MRREGGGRRKRLHCNGNGIPHSVFHLFRVQQGTSWKVLLRYGEQSFLRGVLSGKSASLPLSPFPEHSPSSLPLTHIHTLSEHPREVLRLWEAHSRPNSASHREAVPPDLLHLCRLQEVTGRHSLHCRCLQSDTLHWWLPQVYNHYILAQN